MTADASQRLQQMRAEIDAINRELVALIQRRALVCRRVAAHKKAHGMPLVDPSREADMMLALLRDCGEGFSRESLARIFGAVFDESRSLVLEEGA